METPLDGGDIDLEGLQEIVIGTDHAYLVDEVMALVEGALDAAERYKDGFGELRDRVVQNRSFSVEALQRELSAGQRDLEGFRRDIERYKAEVQAVQGIPQQTTLGVLRLVLDPMVAAFRPSFEACLQSIYSLLPQLANDVYTTFIDKVWGRAGGIPRRSRRYQRSWGCDGTFWLAALLQRLMDRDQPGGRNGRGGGGLHYPDL